MRSLRDEYRPTDAMIATCHRDRSSEFRGRRSRAFGDSLILQLMCKEPYLFGVVV